MVNPNEMAKEQQQLKNALWPIITLGGILIFFSFYLVATSYYPGGSNFDQNENGFNWLTNYWCELLYTYSKNGHINAARPFALTAMISLTISVGYFWYQFPTKLHITSGLKNTIRYTGVISMLLSSFIFTNFHDGIIYGAVVSGTIAFLGSIYGLYRIGDTRFAMAGLFCLLVILGNNFIYLTGFLIDMLPVFQKITFLITLSWIGLLCLRYYTGKTQ